MNEAIVGDQTALGSIGAMVKAGLGYLADLLDRIVCGIKCLSPLALAFGCEAGHVDASSSAPTPVVQEAIIAADAAVVADLGPKPLGEFTITFYYVVGEDEVDPRPVASMAANGNQAAGGELAGKEGAPTSAANGNQAAGGQAAGGQAGGQTELAAVAPAETVTLYDSRRCDPIAEVSREFAQQLQLQGTGKLRDGRVVNIWSRCTCKHSPCFKVMRQQWGTAGSGRALHPFRTVAVDPRLIKLGSLLYIPLLEGRLMPGRAPWGGFVHDGCVVADDTGGGIKGNQLDFFVGRKGWFLGLSGRRSSHAWARDVPVFDGSKLCERKRRKVARRSGAI